MTIRTCAAWSSSIARGVVSFDGIADRDQADENGAGGGRLRCDHCAAARQRPAHRGLRSWQTSRAAAQRCLARGFGRHGAGDSAAQYETQTGPRVPASGSPFRFSHDGGGQRMLAPLLETRRQSDDLRVRVAFRRHDFEHAGLAFSQGAGLVDHERIHATERFDRLPRCGRNTPMVARPSRPRP